MANTDPLAQLKDIHLPTPIGWWPLAPGWYVVIALMVLIFIFVFYWIYKNHRNAKAKNCALILLMNYQKEYEKEHNVALTSARISELLRRVALVYYPRGEVASLHGENWLRFLNATGKGIDFNLVKDMLLDAPFKTGQTMDLSPLFKTAQLWIKQRRVPCSN
ncbi:DUF4381 domain-containing protein [Legionella longbeachae]|uniref:DUF4381 domain-containing protein n=1 Tax=Legionella longbeachae serogroup 1 (strain NSW150) TaxID=661367 RepID=D3HNN1_LEGLN|nr:DUF4381 domain-containing protein [Legionella longbeachae]HBD7398538.1 DUF4381 domain-containing protein [Legionella pneumophila]ARM34226.1 DUF4381 domain-containing protein [Legionella longbeachae]EEZ96513.1 conserved hypothetical protein [Legionella longbeachae D-4968]QEY50043.1 DUF4381 domain-containing protein [Legionella longbeachae]QEY50173.1 DUF4381 domain-containing protein [Legionella longbeachae]